MSLSRKRQFLPYFFPGREPLFASIWMVLGGSLRSSATSSRVKNMQSAWTAGCSICILFLLFRPQNAKIPRRFGASEELRDYWVFGELLNRAIKAHVIFINLLHGLLEFIFMFLFNNEAVVNAQADNSLHGKMHKDVRGDHGIFVLQFDAVA